MVYLNTRTRAVYPRPGLDFLIVAVRPSLYFCGKYVLSCGAFGNVEIGRLALQITTFFVL